MQPRPTDSEADELSVVLSSECVSIELPPLSKKYASKMSLSTNDTQALRGDLRCCMHINNMAAMVDLYIFITACTAILLNKRDTYQLLEEK